MSLASQENGLCNQRTGRSTSRDTKLPTLRVGSRALLRLCSSSLRAGGASGASLGPGGIPGPCSTQFHANVLNQHSQVSFYRSIADYDDTWRPRYRHPHSARTLAGAQLQNGRNCPAPNKVCTLNNSGTDATAETPPKSTKSQHFSLTRFTATSVPTPGMGLPPGQKQYLCTYCRGTNWLSKQDLSLHLKLAHGITKFRYWPEPRSLLVITFDDSPFVNLKVSCPVCSSWFLLGFSTAENMTDGFDKHTKSTKNLNNYKHTKNTVKGLYFNYFRHFFQNKCCQAA